jgi:hypothetical protein
VGLIVEAGQGASTGIGARASCAGLHGQPHPRARAWPTC